VLFTGSVVLAAMDVRKIKGESEHVLKELKKIEIKQSMGKLDNLASELAQMENAHSRISGLATTLTQRFNVALSALVIVWLVASTLHR
jgi:Flp pilus assembly protein TadB